MYTFFQKLISSQFNVELSKVPTISVIDTKGDTITIHFKGGDKRSYRVKLEKLEEQA